VQVARAEIMFASPADTNNQGTTKQRQEQSRADEGHWAAHDLLYIDTAAEVEEIRSRFVLPNCIENGRRSDTKCRKLMLWDGDYAYAPPTYHACRSSTHPPAFVGVR
jgi:hypothetical protein